MLTTATTAIWAISLTESYFLYLGDFANPIIILESFIYYLNSSK
jgi:hypothetical protein